jgi:hypothetical protein
MEFALFAHRYTSPRTMSLPTLMMSTPVAEAITFGSK